MVVVKTQEPTIFQFPKNVLLGFDIWEIKDIIRTAYHSGSLLEELDDSKAANIPHIWQLAAIKDTRSSEWRSCLECDKGITDFDDTMASFFVQHQEELLRSGLVLVKDIKKIFRFELYVQLLNDDFSGMLPTVINDEVLFQDEENYVELEFSIVNNGFSGRAVVGVNTIHQSSSSLLEELNDSAFWLNPKNVEWLFSNIIKGGGKEYSTADGKERLVGYVFFAPYPFNSFNLVCPYVEYNAPLTPAGISSLYRSIKNIRIIGSGYEDVVSHEED